MTKATTIQVRDVLRRYHASPSQIWTNKTKGDNTANRRVKTYYEDSKQMIADLIKVAGPENVKIIPGRGWFQNPAVVVKCVLA